jgi:DNA polymerase III subunit alpha
MQDFTHLHVHTEFSLLDGLSHIDKLLLRAQKQKMKSLAITDHGVMYGAVKFYNAAKAMDIKPIIGVESYLTTHDHTDKTPGVQKQTYHQLLLAKNDTGYKNLMKLTSIAHLEGFYYRPRYDFKTLEKYSEGLVATSSCLQGIIPQFILQEQDKKAIEYCKYFSKLFKDDFYLELQKHQNLPEQDKVNKKLIEFSRLLGIPVVASNDVHYVEPEDAKAQDALLAIQTKTTLNDENRMTMIDSPGFYLKSGDEMLDLFPDQKDALKNTMAIAEKCNVDIPTGKWILPNFPLPKGYSSTDKYFRDFSNQGLRQRFKKITKEMQQRLDYELDIIINKGFSTYFLIVADFVNWSKKNKIRVGPGRGSVAGSLVAYAMRITSIDPLEHNIPFERFMNPQRPSPPDIDLDFADDRRDEVIEYVSNKYGKDRVAQIITFGTMEARGAIRDIGRVLGLPYSDPDKIAKLIPVGFSIEEALVNVQELQEFNRQDKFRELLTLAKKVEGTSRHASTHAAGVVIGDKPLTEYTPLQLESKNDRVTTQYDMYSLDCNIDPNAIGLLKIDFLGLRNLSTLQNSIDYTFEQRKIKVDMSELPLDDKKTYKLLTSGQTIGIFQLESSGMKRVARQLKPNRFSDITAMVALYRPGPMDLIDDFIKGKLNPKTIKYPHDDLKPVLEETYGIAVYQEQALLIANVMAGYSLGEADILRRAIGKKKHSIMDKEKVKFTKRAIDKGYTKQIAEKIWSYIDKFAGYGFNKAHATAYAMIAYQTAYMKANYPVEFMTALLTAESNNKDKIPIAVGECKRMNITVLPPDINQSGIDFTIIKDKNSLNDQAIRFGLSAIKNVGTKAISAILISRKKGKYLSLTDFCRRVDQQKVNKKVLESLIQVGCFDEFGNRAQLLLAVEDIRQNAQKHQTQLTSPQQSLFKASLSSLQKPQDNLPEAEELNKTDLLSFEKQLLGFYLTDNPLADSLNKIKEMVSHQISDLDPQVHLNQTVTLGGVLKSVKKILTKKNNSEMAFATLDDETANIEMVIFPNLYAETKEFWVTDEPILVTGKVDFKDRLALIVDSAVQPSGEELSKKTPSPKSKNYSINLQKDSPKASLVKINQLLQANQGGDTVFIKLKNGHETSKTIQIPYTVNLKTIRNEIERIIKPINGILVEV